MTSTFIQEDKDFLQEQDSPQKGTPLSQTVKAGYIRNLDHGVKQHFENIYKKVINPDFVLCFHCSHDVFTMVKEIYEELDKQTPVAEEPATEAPAAATQTGEVTAAPKKTRTKKA